MREKRIISGFPDSFDFERYVRGYRDEPTDSSALYNFAEEQARKAAAEHKLNQGQKEKLMFLIFREHFRVQK